jgi:hypothetical protein
MYMGIESWCNVAASPVIGYVSKIVLVDSIAFTRLSLLALPLYYGLLKHTTKKHSIYLLHVSKLFIVLLIASICINDFLLQVSITTLSFY